MSQGVLAITEQIDGVFRKVTYEALSAGRRIADSLGCDLTALVLGADIENQAQELKQYGADRILVAEDPVFNEYMTDTFVHAAADIISDFSQRGRDSMPGQPTSRQCFCNNNPKILTKSG